MHARPHGIWVREWFYRVSWEWDRGQVSSWVRFEVVLCIQWEGGTGTRKTKEERARVKCQVANIYPISVIVTRGSQAPTWISLLALGNQLEWARVMGDFSKGSFHHLWVQFRELGTIIISRLACHWDATQEQEVSHFNSNTIMASGKITWEFIGIAGTLCRQVCTLFSIHQSWEKHIDV